MALFLLTLQSIIFKFVKMKKVILIIFGIFLLGNVAKSQGLAIGVKGGYMYSSMETKGVRTFKEAKASAKSGYMLGAFARIGEKFFFQPELQYRVRTADFKLLEVAQNKTEIEIKHKTLDIPLQVGMKVLKLPLVTVTVHGGPVASFKIGNETTLKSEFAGLTLEKGVERLKDEYKSISNSEIGKNDLFFATIGFKLY